MCRMKFDKFFFFYFKWSSKIVKFYFLKKLISIKRLFQIILFDQIYVLFMQHYLNYYSSLWHENYFGAQNNYFLSLIKIWNLVFPFANVCHAQIRSMCTINKNLKEKRNYTNEFVLNKKKDKEKDVINLNKWYVGIFYRLFYINSYRWCFFKLFSSFN